VWNDSLHYTYNVIYYSLSVNMRIARRQTRKEADRRSRRRIVLDAARRLLIKKGIEDTSMEDIAAAAGYTRRTLYAYFRSRDEILLGIFAEDLADRRDRQKRAMADAGTGMEMAIVWGRSFYDYARENPHSLHLQIYWDYRGIDRRRIGRNAFKEFEAVNDGLAADLRGAFQAGLSDGSLRPGLDVDLCISQYIYSLRAILNRALSGAYSFATFDSDRYVNHYLDLFSRAVRNPKGVRK
jgi:AcrR family transcriptional regulator